MWLGKQIGNNRTELGKLHMYLLDVYNETIYTH